MVNTFLNNVLNIIVLSKTLSAIMLASIMALKVFVCLPNLFRVVVVDDCLVGFK